jgi:hypothetical protein
MDKNMTIFLWAVLLGGLTMNIPMNEIEVL